MRLPPCRAEAGGNKWCLGERMHIASVLTQPQPQRRRHSTALIDAIHDGRLVTSKGPGVHYYADQIIGEESC